MTSPAMRLRSARLALAVIAALGVSAGARAESSLQLDVPETFGPVPAETYDESGRRVGNAELRVMRRDDGRIALFAESGIEGAERTRARAELALVRDGAALQLLTQHSRSFDAEGSPLGELIVDHTEEVGRCVPPPGSDEQVRTLELPRGDRVANVPINLLFQPLVRGETQQVDFQLFSCRFGPRLFDARASVAERTRNGGDSKLVEIRYELELPAMLSWAAAPFLPDVAVWFDRDRQGSWVGHRMPLFAKGPTVLVVRQGIAPGALESPEPGGAGR